MTRYIFLCWHLPEVLFFLIQSIFHLNCMIQYIFDLYRISPPSYFLLPLEVRSSQLISYSFRGRAWNRSVFILLFPLRACIAYPMERRTSLHLVLLHLFLSDVDKPTIWLEAYSYRCLDVDVRAELYDIMSCDIGYFRALILS